MTHYFASVIDNKLIFDRICHNFPNVVASAQFFLTGLFAMTEQRRLHRGKLQDKWVMCPTCRQHTNFENIAYANDEHNKLCNSSMLPAFQGHEKSEASMIVRGSFGTKVYLLSDAQSFIF